MPFFYMFVEGGKQERILKGGAAVYFQPNHPPPHFTLTSILRKHNLAHTGERPYICQICDKNLLINIKLFLF